MWKTLEIKPTDALNVKQEYRDMKHEIKEEKFEIPKKKVKKERSQVYVKTQEMLDLLKDLKKPRVSHTKIEFEDVDLKKPGVSHTKMEFEDVKPFYPTIKTEEEDKLPPVVKPVKPVVIEVPDAPVILPEIKVCAANYDAIEVDGHYGLINTGRGYNGESVFVVHTPRKQNREYMLSLKEGDDIKVYNRRTKTHVPLTVRYTTRYKYFSPGVPISMIQVGVDGWV
jgi:hypothetical protein